MKRSLISAPEPHEMCHILCVICADLRRTTQAALSATGITNASEHRPSRCGVCLRAAVNGRYVMV